MFESIEKFITAGKLIELFFEIVVSIGGIYFLFQRWFDKKIRNTMNEFRASINKQALESKKNNELECEVKIEKVKIEMQDKIGDLRDKHDTSRNEMQKSIIEITRNVNENTNNIGKLIQAKEDRDKWNDEFKKEIKGEFQQLREMIIEEIKKR